MRTLSMSLLLALSASASAGPAYWVGSDGDYVRSGFGECVRTIDWTPEKAIAGCEGGDAMKPATKPAAVPATTSPAAKGDKAGNTASEGAGTAAVVAAPAATAPAKQEKPAPQYRQLSLSSGATFELGGSMLSADGKQAVADILGQFQGETIQSVIVKGHTDDRGAAAFNQQLSEKRAAAVRDELIANGVDAGLITIKGYGESQPVADNETREGRAQNRRVEIKVDARKRQI